MSRRQPLRRSRGVRLRLDSGVGEGIALGRGRWDEECGDKIDRCDADGLKG